MKGKHEKKKVQIFELYSVLLLIATLVMSMAYAEMSGTMMSVSTNTEVEAQTGVFITEVTTSDEVNAIVNNYIATVMDSSITLASNGDTKTFNIKVYNSTNKPQVFIDIIKLDETYENSKIACTLSENIVPKTTILQPKSFITFSVTLSYTGSDTPTGEIRSMLNFRFQEVPTIKITPNGAIENIYPDYTPSEYTFIVENANESATNGVPLTYKLSANISAPFIAKIYNESGTEVKSTDAISLAGDGSNVTHTYKLKILWDNSNPENGKRYNNLEYANKSYNCKINLTATPTDENNKYLGYQLTKEESINVKTTPLYFTTEISSNEIEISNNTATTTLTVKNNNGTNYNIFETQYKISIDNNKFTLKIDGTEIGENTLILSKGQIVNQQHTIELEVKDVNTITATETCNIIIQEISPYTKTETQTLTIKDSIGPTAPEITGGSANFATSQTISVSKVATDTGTGVGKYQYLVNANGTTSPVATADVGSTSAETSKTFDTDYNGYYVYFRAVDAVGNVGEWSNAQTLNIDTQPPTVSLVEEGEATIDEGTSYNVADYFTYSANGNAGIKSVTYTVDGQNIENTSGLTEGTHTIVCTVTKDTNLLASASKTVVVESAFTILSSTTKFTDTLGNSYTVPGGFGVRTDLATTVDKGIVIEDSAGNQFVWVPVGTITKSDGSTVTIELGRYTFNTSNGTPILQQSASNYTSTVTISSYYTELATFRESNFAKNTSGLNATAYKLKEWIASTMANGGYYIARYEASFGSGDKISSVSDGAAGVTNQKPQFKQSTTARDTTNVATVTSTPGMLWNYIRQGDASLACRNMYAGNEYNGKDYVDCDLVNSYAWDTAIVFIEKCSENSNYANANRGSNKKLYNTGTDTGKTDDIVCNIYDMAGNLFEYTTEYSSYTNGYGWATPCVDRGGYYMNSVTYTWNRNDDYATTGDNYLGFRGALYIK